ncbi:hypothetical protein GCM10007913_01400 [Devosia yakushimensis]|uniref:Uncharacterized protein n=1 Tax=Devosia yakushimensis TaxID=470028 RepID=A0ABQ5UAL7_9HYPH|nr:hypothetical protein [Devosia yakushimensis]GLQ08208.1 hypothetical protein GCM10007913_01400 [Devosia yakushimensis]
MISFSVSNINSQASRPYSKARTRPMVVSDKAAGCSSAPITVSIAFCPALATASASGAKKKPMNPASALRAFPTDTPIATPVQTRTDQVTV